MSRNFMNTNSLGADHWWRWHLTFPSTPHSISITLALLAFFFFLISSFELLSNPVCVCDIFRLFFLSSINFPHKLPLLRMCHCASASAFGDTENASWMSQQNEIATIINEQSHERNAHKKSKEGKRRNWWRHPCEWNLLNGVNTLRTRFSFTLCQQKKCF